jgi:hypothetical protein
VRYKYRFDHRLRLSEFLDVSLRTFVWRLSDAFIKPILAPGERVFVAGCGHSGTTLLAARLGNLAPVCLIPYETGLFFPARSLRRARSKYIAWIAENKRQGKRVIVEKTPKHIHCWERILKLLPGSKLILMARNPLDTCASLKERFGDLDTAITRYLMDTRELLELRERDDVAVVRYEDFVLTPRIEGRRILNFLNLEWEDALIAGRTSAYDKSHFSDGNMILRQSQVRAEIVPRVNTWSTRLSQAEAERVVRETDAVARRLGYSLAEQLAAA